MLKVINVSKKYGNLLAVDNLSFEVKDGEIFGLLGLNGAGKTTTFRMIMNLLDDYQGSILLDGEKISYNTTNKIGYLTEERSLLTKLTVIEQVIYYGVLKGMNESIIEKELDYWLDIFKIKDYKYKKIKELSKGNQQKVQFITAIIHKPKLLILDEPFSGLDPVNVELFKSVILKLKSEGVSIIFSSHRMEHVELFCDELVILVKGKSVLSGYLKDIKNDYHKKNVHIIGNINIDELKELPYIEEITKDKYEYTLKISDNKYVSDLFKVISKYKDITKFVVEEPTLNEIFISKVGEAYER